MTTMTMRALLVVLFLLSLSQYTPQAQQTQAPAGDPARGKVLWLETEHVECRDCHGVDGEGGFGPDLAGRNLTRAQFIHAVRKPWGIMPAFAESQISDRELNDLVAYFATLPSVDQPGPWKREVPAGASPGLAAATTYGCAQCHAPGFNNGRAVMGAINANFEWFTSIVYAHTTAFPPTQARIGEPPFERLGMGTFSPSRLPVSKLQDIWAYIVDIGFRARMEGHLSAGVPSTDGVVYTLNVENTGVAGVGLAAEDLTVTVAVPAGATVVAATGAGYQGVRRDDQPAAGRGGGGRGGGAAATVDVAVWEVPRIAAGDHQTYTLTLSQAATATNNLRGAIRWTRPTVKTGPSDTVNIAPAPPSP
jgi:mono/diheme cytochrome c family protein